MQCDIVNDAEERTKSLKRLNGVNKGKSITLYDGLCAFWKRRR